MSARITITWCVPIGFLPGEYAQFCGNKGSGAINYDVPLTASRYDLFPDGSGIYGWGLAPFGLHLFGFAFSSRAPGWGLALFGLHPFGYGTAIITILYDVTACGEYKFALKLFDRIGNANEGSPQEVEASIHIAPPAPTGLKKKSYDKDTDGLVLEAA
jgi:hypothetical protein